MGEDSTNLGEGGPLPLHQFNSGRTANNPHRPLSHFSKAASPSSRFLTTQGVSPDPFRLISSVHGASLKQVRYV
jgi:hypothetical protein